MGQHVNHHTSFEFCPLLNGIKQRFRPIYKHVEVAEGGRVCAERCCVGVGLHFGMGLGLFYGVHNVFSYQVEIAVESPSGSG
jgi:hypothetical protein